MAPSLRLTTLENQAPTCEVLSVAVHDSVRLDRSGAVIGGPQLDVVLWNQDRGPAVDLCVVVEIRALRPNDLAEVTLAIMGGNGAYDIGSASMVFQLTKKQALVIFEFDSLELGPEFWRNPKSLSKVLFRVRPGRSAEPFDRSLPVVNLGPNRQVRNHGAPKAVLGQSSPQEKQIVWTRHENPLNCYPRSAAALGK